MKIRFNLTVLIFILLLAVSCKKDFEEINKDPNGFTTASDGSLFNATLSSLKLGYNEQLYLNVSTLYKEVQQAALPRVKWSNYTLGTEEIWSNYYTTLPNFRELERRFSTLDTSAPEVKNMMAMEKIVLAFKTFKVTDMFGDIPFTQAGYGFQDVTMLHPAFDSQESIYKTLLGELKWAAENIDPTAVSDEPIYTFKQFDKLFLGDLSKWRKFANSLRLRYAMRMVNAEPVLAGDIIQDILVNFRPTFGVNDFGQLNSDPNESATLYPYRLGYRSEVFGWSLDQSQDARLGTTMWHLLSSNDNIDGSGIFDPRAYYFFETNHANEWAAYPNNPPSGMQPDGGSPYNYQRDFAYSAKGPDCLYSPVNYYFGRDMDFMPDVLMTGAEVLFLRAEAYLRGIGVAQDASQAGIDFLNGIQFSLDFWQYVMNNSRLPDGTPFGTNITIPSGVSFISLQNNLDYLTTGQLTQAELYEQCWIDLFRQPQEAFALSRRTGMTPHEGNASQVYRFPIPPTEVAFNEFNWLQAVGSTGDNLNRKVWWMN